MSSGEQPFELRQLISLIKTMTNAQLKDILRGEGLAVSGVKLSLQLRIIEYLERVYQNGSMEYQEQLRSYIYSLTSTPKPPGYLTYHPPPESYGTMPSRPTSTKDSSTSKMPSQPFTRGRLSFKDSPFYKILEPLSATVECKVREQTRDTVELKVNLSESHATRLQNDPNLRVMVFCAADNGINQYSKSDIAFPHQVELKVNLDEVKANLRGLKNRPGSTRPADITSYIRKRAGYNNIVNMTFALTHKKFYVLVNLVQRHPVEELVALLRARKVITKDQVLREMQSRADDADIVATSTVMSLKCPLSTLRIQIPCRSVSCIHNQCFDATSFLQLQEQAPTWTCPVCNQSTSYESLQVDQYVNEILHSTSTDVEQVTIEPNGVWHSNKTDDTTNPGSTDPDSDEDFIEISNGFTPKLKREETSEPTIIPTTSSTTTTTTTLFSTPTTQNRTSKGTTPNMPKSGQKRPAPQVVDLTLSDDDDDDDNNDNDNDDDDDDDDDLPIRPPPAKRQALNDFVSRQNSFGRGGSGRGGNNGYTSIEDFGSSTGQEESVSISPGRSNIYID